MRVLGIDPGTAALGYGIVERVVGRLRRVDHGCITTSPAESLPQRLAAIHAAIEALITTHRPDLVGVERLYFSRNAQTAFGVGQARGVVLLAAAQHALEVRESTPNEVKSAVAGHGAAGKDQVGRMVALILGLDEPPTPDDAADALAIAICTANRESTIGARADAGADAASTTYDRAAVAPLGRREPTGYELAVRDALAFERRTRSGS